jgi:hypothetical protein
MAVVGVGTTLQAIASPLAPGFTQAIVNVSAANLPAGGERILFVYFAVGQRLGATVTLSGGATKIPDVETQRAFTPGRFLIGASQIARTGYTTQTITITFNGSYGGSTAEWIQVTPIALSNGDPLIDQNFGTLLDTFPPYTSPGGPSYVNSTADATIVAVSYGGTTTSLSTANSFTLNSSVNTSTAQVSNLYTAVASRDAVPVGGLSLPRWSSYLWNDIYWGGMTLAFGPGAVVPATRIRRGLGLVRG